MRKKYPYLEEPYVYNLNEEQQKRSILSLIDDFLNQRQYVNMTLLDWQENPLKEIQGLIASGSIGKDGSSSVRRTCSLSCSVSKEEYDVDSMQMDFALNKKIFIEIGIKNETEYYLDYPIFWFPQGVFYIDSFSMNSSTTSAVNLNINLKDKMCLLNGDVGGTLPITVQFDTMATQLADGTITKQKVLYYNIITELVHHWGEEDLNNIIIQDVPLRIRRVMQWNADEDIYLSDPFSSEDRIIQIYTEQNKEGTLSKYSKGDRVGYIYDDFVPTSEIVGAGGDTVCTILDTIKNQLGNYEYFYDVFGIFHFREIKNYLNINQSTTILQESGNPGRYINLQEGQFLLDSGSEKQYLIETTNDKNVYTFDSNHNLTSISVTPNYNNIKNDFIVDGIRKSDNSDQEFLIRYRLVIDEKPEIVNWIKVGEDSSGNNIIKGNYGNFNNVLYYTYPEYYEGKIVSEVNKLGFWYDNWVTVEEPNEYTRMVTTTNEDGETVISYQQLAYPTIGNMDQIYRVIEDGENVFYLWTGSGYHKLYLIDETIDASANTDLLFVENTVVENVENSETANAANIINELEGMASFIQGKRWWNSEDGPYFSVNIEDTIYYFYQDAIENSNNKEETLNQMKSFFAGYINTLPYSNIVDFIEYEKLTEEEKENAAEPLYSDIQAIESLLLDRIESLKTKEQIVEGLKQYLNKDYIDKESTLKEIQEGLPQDITDEEFVKRYPNTLNLSDLLDFFVNDNITVYADQNSVNNYIQATIDDLLAITDPLIIYQEILNVITEWDDENISENKSVESLLNYLVGQTDILNPLKYSNYDDLAKLYIKDENTDLNTYNKLQDILKECYFDFLDTYDSDYLFQKDAWGNKTGKDFLGTINSEKGALPFFSNLRSQKLGRQEQIHSNLEKNLWPQSFSEFFSLYDISEYSVYISNIFKWLLDNDYYNRNYKEWAGTFWEDVDITELLIEEEKLQNIKQDWLELYESTSVEDTEEQKNDYFQNAYAELIHLSLDSNINLIHSFERLNKTVELNIDNIENFYNLYQTLYSTILKALNSYKLRNKLAIANQSTEGAIKLKPIIYSSTIGYPDQNNILGEYYTLDWRTYLYLYGEYANTLGTDPGPYFGDLRDFWPYEYNLNRDKQCFIDELESTSEVQYKQLTNGNFFFDMIDASSSPLGEFSVKNIGRRIDLVNDENINCLFEPAIPDVVYLNMDNPDANWSENTTVVELRTAQEIIDKLAEQRQECNDNNQPYVQVSDEIFNNLITGSYLSDAYEQIKYELFAHLKYQKVVSITALPAYYLEPNNRVTLKDYSTNTYGDYMIQNINLTLGPGANMAATLNEVSERL